MQVDRGIAEGTSVSVRGLRQNVYLFNGRQIIDPTGRGGAGLDTLGSSTYGLLSLVPSELISRLELTKLAGSDKSRVRSAASSMCRHPCRSMARIVWVPRSAVSITTRRLKAATKRSHWPHRSSLTTRSACRCRRHIIIAICRSRASIRSPATPASPIAPVPCVSATPTRDPRKLPRPGKSWPQRHRPMAGDRSCAAYR